MTQTMKNHKSNKNYKMSDWVNDRYGDKPKTFEEMLAYVKYVNADKNNMMQKTNDSQLHKKNKKRIIKKIEKEDD